jgi:type II secretory pathway pseudopilin PulG
MKKERNVGLVREHRSQRGYVLLFLLLTMALIAIAAAIVAPKIAFQIKRDREEELIHRGVQYSRAIRNYAKKTGRYPATLEQLLDTGGVRFIRKLYKDPITGGDFRLLHQGDVISLTAPPLNPASNENGGNSDSTGEAASGDANAAATQGVSGASPAGATGPSSATGLTSAAASAFPATLGFNAGNSAFAQGSNNGNSSQIGVIFGVASKSKARSIREFDHKNHYNDWLFFYDPTRDRGAEIKGPTSLSAFPLPQGSAAPNPASSEQVQQQQ